MEELARRFNARFCNPQRKVVGIQSCYDRLRKVWRDNGGQRKPKSMKNRRRSSDQALKDDEPKLSGDDPKEDGDRSDARSDDEYQDD